MQKYILHSFNPTTPGEYNYLSTLFAKMALGQVPVLTFPLEATSNGEQDFEGFDIVNVPLAPPHDEWSIKWFNHIKINKL